MELKILLERLQSILVLGLSVDHAAHEVVVCLIEVAEVRDLFAQVVTLLLLQLCEWEGCSAHIIKGLL